MENSSFIYKNISLLIKRPTSALLISYLRCSAKLHSGELAGIFYLAFYPGSEKPAYGLIGLCFPGSEGREIDAKSGEKQELGDGEGKVLMHTSGVRGSGTCGAFGAAALCLLALLQGRWRGVGDESIQTAPLGSPSWSLAPLFHLGHIPLSSWLMLVSSLNTSDKALTCHWDNQFLHLITHF